MNAQHPGGKNTLKDDAPPALVGYIAGFDSSQPSMPIPAEDERAGVSTASGEYVTFGKAGEELGNGQIFGGDGRRITSDRRKCRFQGARCGHALAGAQIRETDHIKCSLA